MENLIDGPMAHPLSALALAVLCKRGPSPLTTFVSCWTLKICQMRSCKSALQPVGCRLSPGLAFLKRDMKLEVF